MINTAKDILIKNGYTCVLYNGKAAYSSTERGVKPLLQFLQSGADFSGFCAADKVVGAGAAHLYVLLKIKTVWANVISESAKSVFEQNGIFVTYGTLVKAIKNRKGDGLCPIESAVGGITDSAVALDTIKNTLKNLPVV